MNETLSNNSDNALEAQAEVRPEAEVVAAGRAANASVHALEVEHAALEDPARRCADIKIWVEAECDYFGIEPKNDPVADQITEILYKHETNQFARGRDDYDVTTDQRRRLDRVIERGFVTTAETEKTEGLAEIASAEIDETDNLKNTDLERAEAETSYRDFLKSDEYRSASNANKIALMKSRPDVPESEQAKWQAFGSIMLIAQAVPEDQVLIVSRLNQLDMSQGAPNPVGFARAFIFDNSTSHLPSGVSEATQQAVAESLGISRPDVEVTTGSDMTDVFEKGVGTRDVLDPETGEIRTEPLYLQPGEFAPLHDGQSIGLTESGDRAMRFDEEVGSFTVLLPENATAEDMVMYGLAGQMMSQLHDVNMAEMMYPGRNMMERGGSVLDIRLPDDFNRTQQLCQIFFGEFAGYDGSLLNQTDLDRIPYLMQFQNAKGDAVIGDVNPEQMRADYQRQGIIDGSGHFDWDKFAGMVEANRLGLWTGEENHARSAA